MIRVLMLRDDKIALGDYGGTNNTNLWHDIHSNYVFTVFDKLLSHSRVDACSSNNSIYYNILLDRDEMRVLIEAVTDD